MSTTPEFHQAKTILDQGKLDKAEQFLRNEIDWINQYFRIELQSDKINHVLYFSLLWNIYEGVVCNRSCNVKTIENSVQQLEDEKLNQADFEPYLLYFKNRYIASGETNNQFETLRLHRDYVELVKDVLLGKRNTSKDTILALLLIIYRYRNNMFHGEKAIQSLPTQDENFSVSNQVLMKFIEIYNSGRH